MILSGAGCSTSPSTLDAVRAALGEAMSQAEIDRADLVFLFASAHHAADVCPMLRAAVEMSGTEAVVGCSGMRVLTGRGEIEREPGIAALALAGEGLDATPFLARGEDAADQIAEKLRPHRSEESALILLSDPFHYHPSALIRRIQETLGQVPIVGGAASGHPMERRTLQWRGEEIAEDGVSGVLLNGPWRVLTGVAQGCQPFGQAYTVTKAQGNVIHEIAFAPAADALKEALETLTPEEKEYAGRNIFAGLAMDEYATSRERGDFLIRNLIGMNPQTGAIAVAEQVEVGQTIQFNLRTPDAAHADIEQVVGRLATAVRGAPPHFGLYFNCLGRGFGLYGQPDHDISVIRRRLGDLPLVGFFGNAEFAPVAGKNFVHNYTGALALFAERP
jgi:small ligand-binding sensory domain FIST